MSKIGNRSKSSPADVQIINATGVASYTLTRTPSSPNSILVSVGGVFVNSTDFTISGTTIIFTENIESGIQIAIYHLGERRIIDSIGDTGVTPSQYGSSTASPRVQINSDGRIAAASEVEIAYPVGHISGLVGSRNVSLSATYIVASGGARSDTDTTNIKLASTFYKSFSSWTQGAGSNSVPVGSLDTGVAADATWYYIYAIKNPTTGVVDVLVSASPTSPVLPSGFTEKRLVWCIFRETGGTIRNFESAGSGDTVRVEWVNKIADVNQSNISFTAGVNQTFPIATPAIRNIASLNGFVSDATVNFALYISSPLGTNEAISDTSGRVNALSLTTGAARFNVEVANAGTIYFGIEVSTSVDNVKISTAGFTWFR